jgi:hypothetical protein
LQRDSGAVLIRDPPIRAEAHRAFSATPFQKMRAYNLFDLLS